MKLWNKFIKMTYLKMINLILIYKLLQIDLKKMNKINKQTHVKTLAPYSGL